jgi:hypothetical protein
VTPHLVAAYHKSDKWKGTTNYCKHKSVLYKITTKCRFVEVQKQERYYIMDSGFVQVQALHVFSNVPCINHALVSCLGTRLGS